MEGALNLDWPSVIEAKEYVEKNHIEQLFKNLMALLIYRQPRDPFEYVRRQLKKMTKYTFFEEHDLEILYDVLDAERTGCLSREKCAIGLKTLGIGESSMEYSTNCVPKASFIVDCQIALQEKWDLFVTGRRIN